ncbi:MAG: hypothetical protein R6X27_19535 [Candidatus Desulfacyla sp.]
MDLDHILDKKAGRAFEECLVEPESTQVADAKEGYGTEDLSIIAEK